MSSRRSYFHWSSRPFTPSDLDRRQARSPTESFLDSGICSVICLLELAQLDKHYVHGGLGLPGGGLLEYYKRRGLEVRHQPTTDYQRPSEELMENVLSDFDELTPPVLLHCSAAIDRTVPVAAFLVEQRGNSEDAA